MKKFTFLLSIMAIASSYDAYAATGISSDANSRFDDYSIDENCEGDIPAPGSQIIVDGKPHDEWKFADLGTTKSFLNGRKQRYFVNLHNGLPIVETQVCGVGKLAANGPRLKGLLITTPEYYDQKINRDFHTPGYFIRDLPILMNDVEINDRLSSYKNREINDKSLNGIIRDVIVFMRDKNQPVVDVYFPEQDITDGFVVGIVSRAVLDKIIVNGNEYYDEEEISQFMTLQKGDYIWSDILSEDMRWINSYPYRQVDVIFKPGEKQRTTDVILETKDMYPFRIFGGIDNYGSPSTSQNEFFGGFSYGDLFGLDQELIYSFSSGFDMENFSAHSLSYIIPLPELRHKLSFNGTISESEADTGLAALSQSGQNLTLNADYEVPLYDFGLRGFAQSANVGVDYKKLENNLEFGGTQIFNAEPEILQFYTGYDTTKTSATKFDQFTGKFVFSPGDMMDNNNASAFKQASTNANKSQYSYLNGNYDTRYTLPDSGYSVRGLFRGQYSFQDLLSSEQMGISGPGAVRGFASNSVRGDSAVIATAEVATPYISLFDDILGTTIRDRVQGFLFYDQAYATNKTETAATGNTSINLNSAGVGGRFGIGRNLSGVVEYGKEIDDSQRNGEDQELHFRVNASY